MQITREADMLCAYHALQVVPLVGGVRRDQDESTIRKRRPAIIVATPGKLVEHLESTFRFQTLFEALGMLVLDECDELLQEHTEALQVLLGYLPSSSSRQTLMLSATISKEVQDLASRVCRTGYSLLDCVGTGAPTQDSVEQLYSFCPGLLLHVALRNALAEEMSVSPTCHKVIVFFPTARLAAFAARLFQEQLKMRIYELHARCDGPMRIVTQHDFSQCTSGVLFTSGVSERGMDYPNVSLVVQVLAPDSRDQYVHRVGRTARGGKTGRSVLLLLEQEASFLDHVADLPLAQHPRERELLHDEGAWGQATSSANWAPGGALTAAAAGAFASLLRHYRITQRTVSLSASETLAVAGEVLLGCGLDTPPAVSHRLASELGLLPCVNKGELHLLPGGAGADERGGAVSPSSSTSQGPASPAPGRKIHHSLLPGAPFHSRRRKVLTAGRPVTFSR